MKDMSADTLKLIYIQGLLPSVTYALPVWGNGCHSQISRLNELHCKVARMILKTRNEIDEDLLKRIGWDSFATMCKKQLSCMTFKMFKGELQESLTKWKADLKTGRTLRNNHRVKIPSFNKISDKKLFAYRSAIIWNQLSNDAVDHKFNNSI